MSTTTDAEFTEFVDADHAYLSRAAYLTDPDALTASRSAADYAGVEDRDDIARQLALLNPRERAIVVMRFYSDLSEADVAAELGLPPGTVKSTCHRALQRLRSAAEPTTTGA